MTTLWDQFKKIEQRIRRATGTELQGYRDQGAILLRATCEEQYARGRRTPPKQLDEGVLAAARKLGIERVAVSERARMGTAEDQEVDTWVSTSRSLKDLQADLPTIVEALEKIWRELYGEVPEADSDATDDERRETSDDETDGLFEISTPVLYKELEEKIIAAARHRRWADRDAAAARQIAKTIEARTGDVIDVDARIAEVMGEQQDAAAEDDPPLDPEDI